MDYLPKLKEIEVPIAHLVLDPDNPRIQTDINAEPTSDPTSNPATIATYERMKEEGISELMRSIQQNGWQPVDRIFVRRIGKKYLVLEGNRRVSAIQQLLDGTHVLPSALKSSLDPLSVMEILDKEDVKAKITYLLGVRHHGSLKTWRPFAQAHDMYERYLRFASQSDETFTWDEAAADHVAQTLSITPTSVKERLRVYRVMKQIDQLPEVQEIGGIRGHYYSLCLELLNRPKILESYITQDPRSFQLTEEGVRKMDKLCHFSQEKRNGAPIGNPAEWRALQRILLDDDQERRDEMIRAVEDEKQAPSIVYAERAAELRKARWDTWLRDLAGLLDKVKVGQLDEDDHRARDVGGRLWALLQTLTTQKAGE